MHGIHGFGALRRSALLLAMTIAASASAQRAPGPQSRYTRIDNCKVTRLYTRDVGFRETRCAGPAGYALLTRESDGRGELAIVLPGGRERALNLSRTIGSGFGELGATAEWRMRARGPTGVIVRFAVMDDPDRVARASYLAVAGVSATRACVIGKIPPGPRQNAIARRLADAGGPCL